MATTTFSATSSKAAAIAQDLLSELKLRLPASLAISASKDTDGNDLILIGTGATATPGALSRSLPATSFPEDDPAQRGSGDLHAHRHSGVRRGQPHADRRCFWRELADDRNDSGLRLRPWNARRAAAFGVG